MKLKLSKQPVTGAPAAPIAGAIVADARDRPAPPGSLTRCFSFTLLTMFLVASGSVYASSDEEAIEKTYDRWVVVTNAKDLEAWSSYITRDAYFAPPGSPPLETESAILDYYRRSFADPLFSLDCEQLEVNVADSGEIAWARGRCDARFTDASGSAGQGESKWMKIWQKQPDGSWKCRVNSWSMNE